MSFPGATWALHGAHVLPSNQAAIFHHDLDGGRVWVNVSDLWSKLKFTFAPHTGAKYFQARRDRWMKLSKLFDLSELAVRPSLPYDSRNTDCIVCLACVCCYYTGPFPVATSKAFIRVSVHPFIRLTAHAFVSSSVHPFVR
jgi:hypothetical protein